jgi:glyceraldehyde-3-phosphate dehydrogenase/erythrose-4-phosphate dehydrogenase
MPGDKMETEIEKEENLTQLVTDATPEVIEDANLKYLLERKHIRIAPPMNNDYVVVTYVLRNYNNGGKGK